LADAVSAEVAQRRAGQAVLAAVQAGNTRASAIMAAGKIRFHSPGGWKVKSQKMTENGE
jgi:hypothetical protein